jgi:hypothetical protein
MAPGVPSATARWWLLYSNNSMNHKLQMRTSNAATNIQVSTFFQQLFTAVAGTLNATTVTGLEHAIQGSNVRNPASYTGTTSFGLGTEAGSDGRVRTWSFTGRASDGRKNKIFIFGVKSASEGDLRIDTTESADVAAAVTFLNNTVGAFLTISGTQPLWHLYANIGYNDHWIRQLRKIAA